MDDSRCIEAVIQQGSYSATCVCPLWGLRRTVTWCRFSISECRHREHLSNAWLCWPLFARLQCTPVAALTFGV